MFKNQSKKGDSAMSSSNDQSQGKQIGERGGKGQGDIQFSHYPGQIGVLVPNPSLGETNFGGPYPNMPYGPVYAFPPFPFQQEASQGHNNGQWSQGGYQQY